MGENKEFGARGGPDEHEQEDEKETAREPIWAEVLKRVFAVGVSGALLSEEVIRTYLTEVKLPREILNMLIQSAQKSKEELTLRVIKEISQLFRHVDVVKEASRFAETHKFKISAEIEVIPKKKTE